ncbi:MAG: CaiB/BaiF CoA transferase family protein [Nocardioidaceae bacterium]
MSPGPLTGVRVVELAGIGPAPFAGLLLAELGADVVKVDRPGGTGLGIPPQHDLLNRGRPSVCVDLKHPDGAEVVRRLADSADVFLEGYRPGVAERLGLGPEELLARRPQLVYARMTGWGQAGPLADRAGHDIDYIAVAGALHGIGDRDRPAIPSNLVGDFGGGALYLVVGVLAALWEARGSGRGQVVDASIVDGVAHLSMLHCAMLAAGMLAEQRQSNLLDGGTPFYDVYETSDGGHVAVGPLEAQFYKEFEDLLGLDEPLPDRNDPREWPRLRAMLAGRFAERSRVEWTAHFAESDACVAPVLTLTEAAEHPHLAARSTYVHRDGRLEPAPAPRFSRTPTQLGSPPPLPGADTRETLKRWGMDDVEDLLASGAVREHRDPDDLQEDE